MEYLNSATIDLNADFFFKENLKTVKKQRNKDACFSKLEA